MDEGAAEEFKGFADLPSDKVHRNVPRTLLHRDTGLRQRHNGVPIEFQWAAEDKLVLKDYEEMKCQLPGVPTRSTFLMVFSPDGKRVASTHGNHNIYVTDLTSGKNINTLTGHPRTPWCIAFHPSSNQILASGCLGGQVRVWDLHGGSEIWITKSQTVIASIAFHPTERMLVIATYNELYFWDWSQPEPYAKCHTSNEKEKVRYVSFDPLGYKLITGISNAPAVVSQWDRVGPPTTAGSPGMAHGPSTSAGLPHDPDQRRITICYRSLVEQYEQLVQRYYDLTRSRATPTMDRGTDPMDVDPAALGDEALRLRHASCTMAMRCQRGTCARPAQTGAGQSGSGNRPSSSQAGSGTSSSPIVDQHARWRRWLNSDRFCQTGTPQTSAEGSSGASPARSPPSESPVGIGSLGRIGLRSSSTEESSSAADASLFDQIREVPPPPSERLGAVSRRYDPAEPTSYTEANRNRRALTRETSISRRNFLRLLREHHRIAPRFRGAESQAAAAAGSAQGSATNQSPPATAQPSSEERRNLSHIRTYDVSRAGPVLPSFSSDAAAAGGPALGASPDRPRRFFFSQRSAFQPQAPRAESAEQSYAFLEERARRLDSLTRGLYRSRTATRGPPPPPPPPPHETTDIGVRYGIQLLSRHIDNMQRLCRARLEILQLQQIRRMWEDLQLQIRSLHVASRGSGSETAPPVPPRGPRTSGYAAGDARVRHELYRYLSYRGPTAARPSRANRRAHEQRRHYSGRRPGQEATSFRRTTTETSTQAGVPEDEVPPPAEEPLAEPCASGSNNAEPCASGSNNAEPNAAGPSCGAEPAVAGPSNGVDPNEAGPSNGAASAQGEDACAGVESTARGVKRSHSEMEAETPAAEAGPASESQPTTGQGRTTTQSLRSMIARLETLVRQQRHQRDLAASASPDVNRNAPPLPSPVAATLSAEERLATALQNEEYESGRLYRNTLGRQSRLEDWEFTRESTRLRARQVLSLMVESLTQFFEENGLSHNTPHAVLDDQIYNLFILLQLALELTDLLLAQLASTRRELEHQWVHRLRSPVALEAAEATSPREDGPPLASRPTARRGRPSAARRPLFHPRAPRDDSGSARTAGNLAGVRAGLVGVQSCLARVQTSLAGTGSTGTDPASTGPISIDPGSARSPSTSSSSTDSPQSPRPWLSYRMSLFSTDLQYMPESRPTSSRIPSMRSPAQNPLPTSSLPTIAETHEPSDEPAQGTARTHVALHSDGDRLRRFMRVDARLRAERIRAESFRIPTPTERQNDEREFMVQVRRYQNAAPPVPAVRVNDVLVVDPSSMAARSGPPSPPSPPNPRLPWAAHGGAEAETEGGPWRPQRFLHPRYRLEPPPHDTPYEIAGGGDGFNILRVMGPAFATEHVVLADSPVMPNHRIQAWDFTNMYIPDITDVEKNVVAAECKIHNDASVDVSSDGKLLVTLLPSGRLSMTTMLGIYSLQWETLGQCLYTTRFDQNAVSVSLSPVSRHLLVGLASRRVGAIMTDLHTMAQIFRLDKTAGPAARGRLCHLRDIEQGREQPFMSINCIRWAPVAGQGLVFGTNNGQLKVLR